VAGLALGSASACNDIVPLDCGAASTVTGACASADGGEDSSGASGASTATATGESDAGSDSGAVSESSGVGDTGSLCGNGVVDPGEECDDADPIDIDECDNECLLPICGDGIVQPGEDCDFGRGNDDHGACKRDCSAAICGDGVVHAGVEVCDGEDLGESGCEELGYGGGTLACVRTCDALDVGGCTVCADGELCDAYQPCENVCESGSQCWMEMPGLGTCLPPCMLPEDCVPFGMFYTECIGSVCVIPCEQECPDGMSCGGNQLYPGMVCLW
ncbi:MAG TPA: hypothetical protein VFG69_09035, partial [Nannocystaceae bacterium]|nr:hypothetical protein [Nannocystaceae bacterium]